MEKKKSCLSSIFVKGCLVLIFSTIFFFFLFGYITVATLFGGPPEDTSNTGGSCTTSKIQAGALKNINENMPVYKKAAKEVNIPWEMIAGIHFRETTNSRVTPSNNTGDGVYQIVGKNYSYPAGEKLTDEQFLVETIDAAKFIKGKSRPGKFLSSGLTQETTEAGFIKDTFWGYNGRAYGSADNSPYVMNNFDADHMNMPIITRDGGGIDGVDTRNGAYTIFVALKGGCNGDAESAGEKEGSVGYFHDFLKDKSGVKFGVSSGCLDDRNGGKRTHNGYDFTAPVGTKVHAVYSGKVTYIGDWYDGDGQQRGGDSVTIKKEKADKDGALYYQYTHINPSSSLSVGDDIKAGDLVGKVKSLGGPHVDVKKSAKADVPVNARICNGGTDHGLPTNKYEVW